MKAIQVKRRWVGGGAPVFVVAEAGINHQGDPAIALDLIRAAADAGADAIKFQKRSLDRILTRAGLAMPYLNKNSFGATYGEHKRALELDPDAWRFLKIAAESRGLIFFASVWDEESADFLETLDSPLYKIASADLTNLPLVHHVAKKERPVVLSTGMSELWEVDEAVRVLDAASAPFILLQCTSTYPARDGEIHLGAMETYRRRYCCPVGYSGHELGIEISLGAVALGACVIERHLTLDKHMKGGDHEASLEPGEFAELVRGIRRIEAAIGSAEKRLLRREEPIRRKLAKSLVTRVAVQAGQRIEPWMLTTKGPGTGISPTRIDEVAGRVAARALSEDTILIEEDLIATIEERPKGASAARAVYAQV